MKARQLARAGRIPARRASGYAVTVKCFRSRTVKLAAFLVQKWLSLKSLSSSNQVYLLKSHFLTHKTTFNDKNGNTQDWLNKCEFRRRLARRLHFTLLISGYLQLKHQYTGEFETQTPELRDKSFLIMYRIYDHKSRTCRKHTHLF